MPSPLRERKSKDTILNGSGEDRLGIPREGNERFEELARKAFAMGEWRLLCRSLPVPRSRSWARPDYSRHYRMRAWRRQGMKRPRESARSPRFEELLTCGG